MKANSILSKTSVPFYRGKRIRFDALFSIIYSICQAVVPCTV